jgi:hypothetical protein
MNSKMPFNGTDFLNVLEAKSQIEVKNAPK